MASILPINPFLTKNLYYTVNRERKVKRSCSTFKRLSTEAASHHQPIFSRNFEYKLHILPSECINIFGDV